jgi:hypothetical protein
MAFRFWPSSWNWDAIQLRLQNFPIVNVKSLWLIVLDGVTLTWGWTLSYQTGRSGDIAPFNSWLFFLAGLHGFGAWSYQVKRNTSQDGNADEDKAQLIPPRDGVHLENHQ